MLARVYRIIFYALKNLRDVLLGILSNDGYLEAIKVCGNSSASTVNSRIGEF